MRERNELLDALAVLSGGSVETVTGSMWGAAAKALSEIKAVCQDVTPEMISAAVAAYRREWPKATPTPSALAKHWSQFAPGAKKDGGRTVQGVQEPTTNWREVARELGLRAENWAMLERADKIRILRGAACMDGASMKLLTTMGLRILALEDLIVRAAGLMPGAEEDSAFLDVLREARRILGKKKGAAV